MSIAQHHLRRHHRRPHHHHGHVHQPHLRRAVQHVGASRQQTATLEAFLPTAPRPTLPERGLAPVDGVQTQSGWFAGSYPGQTNSVSGEEGRDQTKSPPLPPPGKPISSSRTTKPGQNGPPLCGSLLNKGQVLILFVSVHAGFWHAVMVLIFKHQKKKTTLDRLVGEVAGEESRVERQTLYRGVFVSHPTSDTQ